MVGAYGVGEVLTRLETGFADQAARQDFETRAPRLPTLKELQRASRACSSAPRWSAISSGCCRGAGATDRVVRKLWHRGALRHAAKNQMGTGIAGGHRCAARAAATAFGRRRHGSSACARHSRQRRNRSRSSAPSCCTASSPDRRCSVSSAPLRLHRVRLAFPRPRALMCAIGYFAIRPAGEDPRFSRSGRIGLRADPLLYRAPRRSATTSPISGSIIGFVHLGLRLRTPEISSRATRARRHPRSIAEEAFMNTDDPASRNDWTVFFTRPISGTIVAFTIIVLLLPFVQASAQKPSV